MNNHGISGETMNAVYDVLKTMTLKQLDECVTEAVIQFKDESARKLFLHQVAYTIDKKIEGEW